MAKQGFQTFNKFKNEIKELKQLYDLTAHLYMQEHTRVEGLIPEATKPVTTISTKVGIVNHSLNSLYQSTRKKYPDKLRQLILISSITSLEVFLTDLIGEIFQRDTQPFEEQLPIEFAKSQLLNSPSIKGIHNEIIRRDIRRLTSGGLTEIRKYYLSKFKIDFGKFGVSINEIDEIHTRRHIHVHRNGKCDKEYVNKYPKMGYKVDERIIIEHDYLVESLNKLSEFASEINKAVIERYPDYTVGFNHFYNTIKKNSKIEQQRLMLEFRLISKKFDIETYLKGAAIKKHKLINYIEQISVKDRTCFAILFGESSILTKFFSELKSKAEFDLYSIIELKI